ncbi:MAG: hypothetical protein ACT4PS_02295 [Betaproteobacteria bacterium]
MASKFGTVFGAIFIVAGLFFTMMPLIAPHLQGGNPGWFSVLGGVLFITAGAGVIQIHRCPDAVPLWVGLMAAAMGAFIIVMAGFDPDESRFHAPRWVVGAAGATFVLAGAAAIKSKGTSGPHTDNSPGYLLILALLLTCFGAVASWVSFGPGERKFEGTLSVADGILPFELSEMLGRILFSPAALLLDFMALAAWFFLFRGILLRLRGRDSQKAQVRPRVH